MAIQQDPFYLDNLFVQDVNELERLGKLSPRTNYHLLQISAILRRLVLDEQPLAIYASTRLRIPLLVLVPEPISGNANYPGRKIPPNLLSYAPQISEETHPSGLRGFFLRSYTLQDYLATPHMVLPDASMNGRAITPKEMIKFFANKLGGVHADKNLVDRKEGGGSIDAETLHLINKTVSIFGEDSLFQQFGVIGERVWRCCGPLRDRFVDLKALFEPPSE